MIASLQKLSSVPVVRISGVTKLQYIIGNATCKINQTESETVEVVKDEEGNRREQGGRAWGAHFYLWQSNSKILAPLVVIG